MPEPGVANQEVPETKPSGKIGVFNQLVEKKQEIIILERKANDIFISLFREIQEKVLAVTQVNPAEKGNMETILQSAEGGIITVSEDYSGDFYGSDNVHKISISKKDSKERATQLTAYYNKRDGSMSLLTRIMTTASDKKQTINGGGDYRNLDIQGDTSISAEDIVTELLTDLESGKVVGQKDISLKKK